MKQKTRYALRGNRLVVNEEAVAVDPSVLRIALSGRGSRPGEFYDRKSGRISASLARRILDLERYYSLAVLTDALAQQRVA